MKPARLLQFILRALRESAHLGIIAILISSMVVLPLPQAHAVIVDMRLSPGLIGHSLSISDPSSGQSQSFQLRLVEQNGTSFASDYFSFYGPAAGATQDMSVIDSSTPVGGSDASIAGALQWPSEWDPMAPVGLFDGRSATWPGSVAYRTFLLQDPSISSHSISSLVLKQGSTFRLINPSGSSSTAVPVYSDFGNNSPIASRASFSAPLDLSQSFSVVDLDTREESASGDFDLALTTWGSTTSLPMSSVRILLNNSAAGQRFTLHSRHPGQTDEMLQSVNTISGPLPEDQYTQATWISAAIPWGVEFWLIRDYDQQTSESSANPFALSVATASYSAEHGVINSYTAYAFLDLPRHSVTVNVDSSLASQQLFVRQDDALTPITIGPTEQTYEDYTLGGRDNTWHYYPSAVDIVDNEPFCIVDANGNPLASVGDYNAANGWAFQGGTPADPGTDHHFSFQLPASRDGHQFILFAPDGTSASFTLSILIFETFLLSDYWNFVDLPYLWASYEMDCQPDVDFREAWTLHDDTIGDTTAVEPGENDLRAWFAPPVLAQAQISLSRWDHTLTLRSSDGSEYPVTKQFSQGNITAVQDQQQTNGWFTSAYYFEAQTSKRPGVDYWIWDATTGEEAPWNTLDLKDWIAARPPWNLTATVDNVGVVSLHWTAGPGLRNLRVERRTGGNWLAIKFVTPQATQANYQATDEHAVPGTLNRYRIVGVFNSKSSAPSAEVSITVPPRSVPLSQVPAHERDEDDNWFVPGSVLANPPIPVRGTGVTQSPGGGVAPDLAFENDFKVPPPPDGITLQEVVHEHDYNGSPSGHFSVSEPMEVKIVVDSPMSSTIQILRSTDCVGWSPIASGNGPHFEHTDSGLNIGGAYYYRAVGITAAGSSNPGRILRWVPPCITIAQEVTREAYFQDTQGDRESYLVDTFPDGFPDRTREIWKPVYFNNDGTYESTITNGEAIPELPTWPADLGDESLVFGARSHINTKRVFTTDTDPIGNIINTDKAFQQRATIWLARVTSPNRGVVGSIPAWPFPPKLGQIANVTLLTETTSVDPLFLGALYEENQYALGGGGVIDLPFDTFFASIFVGGYNLSLTRAPRVVPTDELSTFGFGSGHYSLISDYDSYVDYRIAHDWNAKMVYLEGHGTQQIKFLAAPNAKLQSVTGNFAVYCVGTNGHWTRIQTGQDLPEDGQLVVIPTASAVPDTSTGKVKVYFKDYGSTDSFDVLYFGASHQGTLVVSADDAAGPAHRRVALNGRPIPDASPENKSEDSYPLRGAYVDALTQRLHYEVADVALSIPGSSLAVELRRQLAPTIWNDHTLPPDSDIFLPFGIGWSSGLGANIKIVSTDQEQTSAYVTDHTGATHRFLASSIPYGLTETPQGGNWIPLPSGIMDSSEYENSLSSLNGFLEFRTKHGTITRFRPIDGLQNRGTTASGYGGNSDLASYFRIESVSDSLGNTIQFGYSDTPGLHDRPLPTSIYHLQSPTRRINIRYHAGDNRVEKIWDPKGNVTQYDYGTCDMGSGTRYHSLPVLSAVRASSSERTAYVYEVAQQDKSNPQLPFSTFWYLDLKSITDGLNHPYVFTYAFDITKSSLLRSGTWFTQAGLPRQVRTVTLPTTAAGAAVATFEDQSAGVKPVWLTNNVLTVEGTRKTVVTDVENKKVTYLFTDGELHVLDLLKQFDSAAQNLGASGAPATLLLYKTMTVERTVGSQTLKETLGFSPQAGMALSHYVDAAGHETRYGYEQSASGPFGGLANSLLDFATKKSQPSWEENNAGARRYYAYDPFDFQAGSIDETARAQVTLSTSGRPEKKFAWALAGTGADFVASLSLADRYSAAAWCDSAAASSPVQIQDFSYGDAAFPGVATEVISRRSAEDPTWATDQVTSRTLDGEGNIESETAGGADGVTHFYTYDLNGNRTSVEDAYGYRTTSQYDFRNRLQTVLLPTPSGEPLARKSYEYDRNGNLLKETFVFPDAAGAPVTVATINVYDALNRLTRATKSGTGVASAITDFTYTKAGLKKTTTDPKNVITENTYDAAYRLTNTTETTPAPSAIVRSTTFAYPVIVNGGFPEGAGSGFSPIKVTDPRGYISRTIFDSMNRPITNYVAYGAPNVDPASPLATATAYTYTDYDEAGRPTVVTDDLGNETKTEYDELGRVQVVTLPDSTVANPRTVQNFYTGTGLKWKVKDEAGNLHETEFDSAGREARSLGPVLTNSNNARAETLFDYDIAGNLSHKRVRLGNGNTNYAVWTYLYDGRNQKTDEFGPATASNDSPRTQWKYDGGGRVISVQDARGKTTDTQYDALGRVRFVISPDVNNVEGALARPTVEKRYDIVGNVTDVFDAEGRHTVNVYDDLNRLTNSTDPASITVSNTYDNAGNLLTVKDGKNQVTTFEYDGLNRQTLNQPTGEIGTQKIYDALNLTLSIDGNGVPTHYTYDPRNRLTGVYFNWTGDNGQDPSRAYHYDAAGNLLSVTDESPVAYAYDEMSRVTSETSNGLTHTYEYDLGSRRTFTEFANVDGHPKRSLTTQYDARGLATSISEKKAGETTPRLSTFEYDLNGNLLKKALPGGDVEETTYDALNRQRQQTIARNDNQGTPVVKHWHRQSYDRSGNVRVIEEGWPGATPNQDRRLELSYDGAQRLDWERAKNWNTAATPPSWIAADSVKYQYDNANNRTWKKRYTAGQGEAGVPADAWGGDFNERNQLGSYQHSHAGTVADTRSFSYDLNGNRINETISAGGTMVGVNYYFDFANRLYAVEEMDDQNEVSVAYSYGYDYRTRRTQRDGTLVSYSGGTSVAEFSHNAYDSGYHTDHEFIRGSDWGGGVGGILYTAQNESGVDARRNHFYNSRGDVVLQTNSADGTTAYDATYQADGQRVRESGFSATRQRANTKEEDPNGLLNEGMRYRDLETGVFLTRDPAGFIDGPNLYAYVRQNPWSKFDPEGLTGWAIYNPGAPSQYQMTNPEYRAGYMAEAERGLFLGTVGFLAATGAGEVLGAAGVSGYTGAVVSNAAGGYVANGVGNKMAGHDFNDNAGTAIVVGGVFGAVTHATAGGEPAPVKAGEPAPAPKLASPGEGVSNPSGSVVAPAAEAGAVESAAPAPSPAAGGAGEWKGPTDYSGLKNPKDVTTNTKPTPRQARQMKEANRVHNEGELRDDVTGESMVDSAKSQSGMTPPTNEAQVDHVTPRSKGGTRAFDNLQLRTRKNNRIKSDSTPNGN